MVDEATRQDTERRRVSDAQEAAERLRESRERIIATTKHSKDHEATAWARVEPTLAACAAPRSATDCDAIDAHLHDVDQGDKPESVKLRTLALAEEAAPEIIADLEAFMADQTSHHAQARDARAKGQDRVARLRKAAEAAKRAADVARDARERAAEAAKEARDRAEAAFESAKQKRECLTSCARARAGCSRRCVGLTEGASYCHSLCRGDHVQCEVGCAR